MSEKMTTATDKYGAIMAGHAAGVLEQTFGGEWIHLKRGAGVVACDFLDAAKIDGTTARDYANNIGKGNLQRYADTLLATPRSNGGAS